MIGSLPQELEVHGKAYPIRADFRDVLAVLEVQQDVELDIREKIYVTIFMLYSDFSCYEDVVNSEIDIEEAYLKAVWFLDLGEENDSASDSKPTYDWKMDEQLIFSSINHIACKETRAEPFLHYWTFMGYFNEIKDGMFMNVIGIRDKLNKKKKLEKWEKELVNKNPKMFHLKNKGEAQRIADDLTREIKQRLTHK